MHRAWLWCPHSSGILQVMQYQVPQFIEVEDKIFGPFTLKQFVYVAGGVGLCAIFILYLPLLFGVLLSIPVAALTAALAFYKVNNKSFVEVAESAFKYYTAERLYLWKKEQHAAEAAAPVAAPERAPLPTLSRSKLHDLAWSLDVQAPDQKNDS